MQAAAAAATDNRMIDDVQSTTNKLTQMKRQRSTCKRWHWVGVCLSLCTLCSEKNRFPVSVSVPFCYNWLL